MGDRGRRRPGFDDAAPSAADAALPELPAASGHRFGPGLVCSECGIRWDAHKREPAPCRGERVGDPFARRPDPGRAPRAVSRVASSAATPEAERAAAADPSRDDGDA